MNDWAATVTAAPRPRPSRALTRVTVMTILTLGFLFVATQPASAHAQLLGVKPADGATLKHAPQQAELKFDESVQIPSNGVRLFDQQGDSTTLTAQVVNHTVKVSLPQKMEHGSYALSWRVISADTHIVSGVVNFTVGTSSQVAGTPSVPHDNGSAGFGLKVANVMHYTGLLPFVGLIFFLLFISPPDRRRPVWIRRLLPATGGVTVLGSLLAIPLAALEAVGLPIWSVGTLSGWVGDVEWQRLVVFGVTISTVGVLLGLKPHTLTWPSRTTQPAGSADPTPQSTTFHRRRGVAALALVGFLVASQTLIGHSMTKSPRWAMITGDVIHLLAGSVWFGGLIGVSVFLAATRRNTPADAVTAAATVARFSRVAGWTVLALAASGAGMAIITFDAWTGLFLTDYGRALLIKLGLVGVVVALAWWNRSRLVTTVTARQSSQTGWQLLRQLMGYEAAILTAVIIVTSALVELNPTLAPTNASQNPSSPNSTAATTKKFTVSADQLTVAGTIHTSQSRAATLTFQVTNKQDNVVQPVHTPTVKASLPAQQIGPIQHPAKKHDDTAYRARFILPAPGQWKFDIPIRTSKFNEPIATITARIR